VKPKRIQLHRTKGWHKPAGVVTVSRPTKWGNPFALDDYESKTRDGSFDENKARALMVRDYERALKKGELPVSIADAVRELRGKDLACWCPLDKQCHADVLLKVANGKGSSK
jgi:hypothetical protein